MGIGKDSFELKKMFDNDNEVDEAQMLGIAKDGFASPTTTEPTTEPTTKPADPKPKPRSPIAPKPGVMPMPKPKANKDVDLFLQKRGLK